MQLQTHLALRLLNAQYVLTGLLVLLSLRSVYTTGEPFPLMSTQFNDRDGDGLTDDIDLCPDFYDPSNLDYNNNGIGDYCENTDVSYTPASSQPNILWISVEDMSPQLASYGDATAATPNLDQLANEGVRYTNTFTTAGVCAPSRAAIITGMHQNSIGAQHMRTLNGSNNTPNAEVRVGNYEAVPPPDVKTFTEYLRAAGYFVTNASKTDFQFKVPLTTYDLSANNKDWRDRPDANQPFFSIININLTHESRVWRNAGQFGNIDPNDVPVPPYYPNTQLVREDLAVYYNNIAKMDNEVGNILNRLRNDGLDDNTIVFFFSDHGAGLPRSKRDLYDGGTKIPLIIRFPDGSFANTVTDQLVSAIDFAPTLLKLAGVEVPDYMQGTSFLDPAASDRAYVHAAKDRTDESYDYVRTIRNKQYKLIRNYDPSRPYIIPVQYRNQMNIMQELYELRDNGNPTPEQALWLADSRPEYELYDITLDPFELHNLADDPAYASILSQLQADLDAWMIQTQGTATPDVSDLPSAEEALLQAGWPGGVQPTTAAPSISQHPDGKIAMASTTEGASIGYKINNETYWQVYTEPFDISGSVSIKARAIRIGYKESSETTANFDGDSSGSIQGTLQLGGRTNHEAVASITMYPLTGDPAPLVFEQIAVDQTGNFSFPEVPGGSYDCYLEVPHFLTVFQSVQLELGTQSIDFGTLPAGDADLDNAVGLLDFSLLAASFNLSESDPGYVPGADFNGDGLVNLLDFSLLANNFLISGASPE